MIRFEEEKKEAVLHELLRWRQEPVPEGGEEASMRALLDCVWAFARGCGAVEAVFKSPPLSYELERAQADGDLLRTARYWFRHSRDESLTWPERYFNLENAYNHAANAAIAEHGRAEKAQAERDELERTMNVQLAKYSTEAAHAKNAEAVAKREAAEWRSRLQTLYDAESGKLEECEGLGGRIEDLVLGRLQRARAEVARLVEAAEMDRADREELIHRLQGMKAERDFFSETIQDLGKGTAEGGKGTLIVRCPFHEEQTPSCIVDVVNGTFHCFGCGARGDVAINVVMRREA